MIKTYTQAVKYLESFIPTPDKKHPGSLGLKRMQTLMDLLGNPQLAYPTIHVGGTSGKGSTATIIASILATKYKVGLHTSPHLERINERIRVIDKSFWGAKPGSRRYPAKPGSRRYPAKRLQNRFWTSQNDKISDKDFVRLLYEVQPSIKVVEKSRFGTASYFEIVTAMAFLYFKQQKVDMAVIEVGMGGMFDATNVIKPLVAVITNVGLDHTEILGDTVEKIARDKAGIIKPGIEVVTGVRQPSVIKIIEAKGKRQSFDYAQDKKAKISLLDRDFSYQVKKMDETGSIFDYFGDHTYKNLKLSLLGEHQVENAALAIRTVELLYCHSGEWLRHQNHFQSKGFWTSQNDLEKNIRQGLEYAFIPGRLEIIHKKPLVILDGAHNPDKMKALVAAIKKIYPKRPVTSIIAIKSGKDAYEILKEILPICHEVIFTKFRLTTDLGDTYSYTPAELIRVVRGFDKIPNMRYFVKKLVIEEKRAVKAVKDSIKDVNSDGLILVTGSLYLVGEIRKFLISNI